MRSRIIQEHGGDSSKGGSTHTEVRAVRRDNLSSPTKRSLSYKLVTSLTITMKIAITTLPIQFNLDPDHNQGKRRGVDGLPARPGHQKNKTRTGTLPYPSSYP